MEQLDSVTRSTLQGNVKLIMLRFNVASELYLLSSVHM